MADSSPATLTDELRDEAQIMRTSGWRQLPVLMEEAADELERLVGVEQRLAHRAVVALRLYGHHLPSCGARIDTSGNFIEGNCTCGLERAYEEFVALEGGAALAGEKS